MKVYIVNGFGGSGKDSFENFVRQRSQSYGIKTSMVETVKKYAEQMGWKGGKTDKDRRFLSDLKDALERWDNTPLIDVYTKIKINSETASYCFVDAREKKDIEKIKTICEINNWECKTILVDRKIMKDFGNHADDEVMDNEYNITIMNTGTIADLERQALAFIEAEGL